jgi:hypothetical protein
MVALRIVVGNPLDAMPLDIRAAGIVGRDVHALAFAVEDFRVVFLGVDLDFVVVGRLAERDFRDDFHRLAGRQHPVHARRADADPLLAATHPQAVELGSVQQLAEDQRDLLLDDPGAVVLDTELKAVFPRLFDVDPDLGKNPALFASVQRIIHGFFDGGQQGFARVVETQQVPVLGEKLADRDIALFRRHSFGGRTAAGLAVAGNIVHSFRISVGFVFRNDQRGGQRRHSFTAGANDAWPSRQRSVRVLLTMRIITTTRPLSHPFHPVKTDDYG